MGLITDPWFYAVAVPAILLLGLSKAGFGAGVGGFIVPLLALAIPPRQAAAVLLPILCAMDLLSIRAYRGSWDSRNTRILLPGGLIGIAVGTLSFGLLSEAGISILIGTIAVVFGLQQWLGLGKSLKPCGASVGRGLFWSGLSGFTSFVAHAGGPPLMVYLLPQRLDKRLYVGTAVLFFFVVNYVKLIPYAWLGQLNFGNLATSLVLLPLAPAGIRLGVWAQNHLREALFYRIVVLLLLASGGKLLFDGLRVFA
jgi:hypothetical protein